MGDRTPSLVCQALGGQHLIRITPYDDPDDPRFAYVDVQLLEHAGWHAGLRLRIRNALRMLRGHYDSTGFLLESAEEAEAMIEALRSASEVAFGNESAPS